MARALQVNDDDSVATLLEDCAGGETVRAGTLETVARGPIGRGHKIALVPIASGAPVLKYGQPIGLATRAIAPGDHVHSDNVHTGLSGTLDYRFDPAAPRTQARTNAEAPSFWGYRRADGRVATRNEIWVLPTVGCVARTAERIAAAGARTAEGRVDGVHAFTHPHGCSQLGSDLGGTRAVLTALADHPNAGGVLIVGLGCEENQLSEIMAALPEARRPFVRTLVTQLAGDEQAEGEALIAELVAQAATSRREPVPLSALVLGVKCGGSDGLSGLTANPLVGRIADRVAEAGGTVVQTEIPEMFGAEQVMMDRAADERVFGEVVELVNGFKRYFLDHGQPVSENPSPGNVAGGITTLEEKSLGAVQKGGRAIVTQVLPYGGQAHGPGLVLLEAPGNDAVSSTALAAAGATVILFTTGRGTPLGFPVPTVKIASNADLAARKPGWIDFDAGQVLDAGFDASAEALLTRITSIAGGEPTANERNGEREIAIWKRGVTL